MKKYFLIIITIFFLKISFSQYQPLPMQNAYWVCYGGVNLLSCPICIPVNYMYYTDGDTIINSTIYVKIKKTEQPLINDVSVFPAYTGAIRQDTLNRKIYIILSDSITEKILYDFSLQVGDTVNSILHDLANDCFGYNVETISSIDSVLINGNYHRKYNLQGSCGSPYYIEGIGSIYGLIFPNRLDQKESHLDCLKINGQTYYPNNTTPCNLITSTDDLQEELPIYIYPNPFNNTTTILYYVPLGSKGFLQITDTKGELVDEYALQQGKNKLEISMAGFKTGVYFYSMVIDGVVKQTKKMLFEK